MRPSTGDTSPQGVPRRSTRDRPAKAPLSTEVVVDAALALLRGGGPEAVTMRSVALALDTGPASLYAWIPGRQGLLEAMVERVTSAVALEPPDPHRWRSQLQDLLARLHQAFRDHPGVAATTLSDPPTTQAVLRLAENLLGLLLAGGLVPQDSAWACDILVSLVRAIAVEDDVRRSQSTSSGGTAEAGAGDADAGDADAAEVFNTFSALPAAEFPLLSTFAAQMAAGSSVERLRFAVDTVLDGLLSRASRP